ncbi:MAG: hypothetical protein ABI442_17840 [Gemmatimonadaceae bacterium]
MSNVVTFDVVKPNVAEFTANTPAPEVVPADRSSAPPFKVHVKPVAIVIVPVFVKLGVVPV